MEKYYTLKQTSKILNVSVSTLYRRIKDGIIVSLQIGGRGKHVLPRKEIDRFLQKSKRS